MTEIQTAPQSAQDEQPMGLADDLHAQVALPFDCPECRAEGTPRQFKNAQGLARHRSAAHNVRGTSSSAQRRRRSSSNGGRPSRRGRPAKVTPLTFNRIGAAKLIAPDGMVSLEAMQRVIAWLDEGEAIFAQRA